MTNQEYTPDQIAVIKEPIDYKGPNGEHYSAHPDKYFSKKGFGNTVGKDLTKEKMIAVHVTNTFPEDGIIHPVNHYDPLIWRFSVHFSMNHPVGGHAYGNWDDKNHAILIPFEKIEDKTTYFTSVDSFTLGDLEIPTGSHILTRDENGSIEKTVYQKIKDEGYVAVDGGAWNWRHGDEWSSQDFDHFLKKTGLKSCHHTFTPYSRLENLSPSTLVDDILRNKGLNCSEIEEGYNGFVKEKGLDEIISIAKEEVPSKFERKKISAMKFLKKCGNEIPLEYSTLVRENYDIN